METTTLIKNKVKEIKSFHSFTHYNLYYEIVFVIDEFTGFKVPQYTHIESVNKHNEFLHIKVNILKSVINEFTLHCIDKYNIIEVY